MQIKSDIKQAKTQCRDEDVCLVPGVWVEVCDFVRLVGIGLAGWFVCDFQMTAQWVVPAVLKPPPN